MHDFFFPVTAYADFKTRSVDADLVQNRQMDPVRRRTVGLRQSQFLPGDQHHREPAVGDVEKPGVRPIFHDLYGRVSVARDEEIGQWITSDVLVLSNWFSASYKDFERGRLLTANDYRVGDDEFYPFEVGSEIEFTLNLPPERLGETPDVTLVYDNDLGSIPVKLTKVSESEYTFSYTPENKYGFSVWINWSDFDTTVYDDEHFYVEL